MPFLLQKIFTIFFIGRWRIQDQSHVPFGGPLLSSRITYLLAEADMFVMKALIRSLLSRNTKSLTMDMVKLPYSLHPLCKYLRLGYNRARQTGVRGELRSVTRASLHTFIGLLTEYWWSFAQLLRLGHPVSRLDAKSEFRFLSRNSLYIIIGQFSHWREFDAEYSPSVLRDLGLRLHMLNSLLLTVS